MKSRYLILLAFLIISIPALTQDELPTLPGDTLAIESGYDPGAPRKAFLYAALLPGLGQAYNKQYWKMPFVYGGFFTFGYIISFYNQRHTNFKGELFNLLEDPAYLPPSGANESQLRTLIDRARRERDYMVVLTGAFYILQIVDAHVDAHLREFDLNPELQVKVKPSFEPVMTQATLGVGIKFTF